MAFPQDWPYKLRLTIRAEYIPADFSEWTLVFDETFNPVFQEPDSPLAANGPRPLYNSAGDIRFSFDKEGNERLPCHIRQGWAADDPADGRLEVAVKIPFVSSSQDTIIWMWWGNWGETQPSPNTEFGAYNAYRDSAYAYIPDAYVQDVTDPEQSPVVDSQEGLVPLDEGGLVGTALDSTDGSGQIRYDPERNIIGTAFTTIFGYYKRGKGGGDRGSFLGDNANNHFGHVTDAGDEGLHMRVGGTSRTITPQLANDEWHAVSVKRDGTTWTSRANRQEGTTGTSDTVYPLDATIGIGTTANRAPNGIIDELQIYTEALPDAYIDSTADNLLNTDAPRGIVTWGYVFYPEGFATGEPELGEPVLQTQQYLNAEDITTGEPALQETRLVAERDMLPEDIRLGDPVLEESTLWTLHKLEGDVLTSAAPIIDPTILLVQIHRLHVNNVSLEPPVIQESVIHQTHHLEIEDITTGAPVIDESVIHQTHNFEDQEGISTEAPVINDSFIWQLHKVGTGEDVVTGAPVFDPETLFIHQTHNFIQEGFSTGEPVLNDSFIHQTHHIEDQEEFTANTPVLEDAFMGKGHLIFTDDLIAEPADLGEPSIFEKHHFDSLDITWFQPELGESTIRATHKFQAEGFATGAPSIEIGVVVYQSLHPDDIVWEAPIIGEAELGQGHLIKEERITTRMPKVGESDIAQTHKDLKPRDIPRFLVVGGVRFEPKLGEPTLRTEHPLQSVDLATDEPEIGNPELTVVFHFDAEGIETDVPVVNESTLTHVYVFDTENIIGEAAVLDSVTIRQEHKVQGDGFATDLPYIDTSEIGVRFLLGGDGITAGPVYLGQPELTLSFALEPAFITWEEPSLGQPDVSQAHNLRPRRRRLQAPILGTPFYRMKETQDLIARGFRTGIPQVNTSGIDGMTEPAPPKTPTAGIDPTAVEVHHDIQIVKQIGYLRRYSPEEIRDTWHQTGALQAESDYTHVYGGGGIYQIIDPDSDLHEAIVLFMQPRFWKIDWSKYRMKGMSPHPQHVETGQRLEFVYVLLTRQEWKALEGEVNEDFESFYVRRERIPLITG